MNFYIRILTLSIVSIAIIIALAIKNIQPKQATMAVPIQSFKLPTQIFNATLINRIFNVWYEGHHPDARWGSKETMSKWFGQGDRDSKAAFDNKCKSTGIDALDAISPEKLALPPFTTHADDRKAALSLSSPFRQMEELRSTDWDTRAKTGLGLMILLDQFPRNIFRDEQWKIYSHYDRLSRALAHSMIQTPEDENDERRHLHGLHKGANGWELSPVRRLWFYMPLMHSEDLHDHDEFASKLDQLIEDLEKDGDQESTDLLKESRGFESKHRVILEQFGRYPYRNEYLGRKTTPEEAEWLKTGETFGTS